MPGSDPGLLSSYLCKRRLAVARPHLAGRVLDVGCATGVLADVVPPDRYVGTDNDSVVLEEARALHPSHTFLTPEELPKSESFATIAALAVIEHVPDPAGWLLGLAGHLEPGGRIVLTTPHARWEHLHGWASKVRLTSPEAHDQHDMLFDRPTLVSTLKDAGLQLAHYERFMAGMNQLAIAAR